MGRAYVTVMTTGDAGRVDGATRNAEGQIAFPAEGPGDHVRVELDSGRTAWIPIADLGVTRFDGEAS